MAIRNGLFGKQTHRFGIATPRIALDNDGDTTPVYAPFWARPGAAPSGTAAEGDLYPDDTAGGYKQHDGTVFRALSDRHIITRRYDANSVDSSLFIADRAYVLKAVRAVPTIAGTDAGAVTLDIKKCTGTQAPSAGVTMLTATINLKATINTVIIPTLSATGADLLLAAGDRIATDYTGVLTAAVGMVELVLEQV